MYNNSIPQMQPFNYIPSSSPYIPSYSQPAQQSPQTNVSWVYVNGMDGARAQIVQPGQTSWMMDNSDSIIYVKAVDSMGTATLKGFRLTEISSATPATKDEDRVSKEDLNALSNRIRAIEDALGGLNA